MNAKHILSATTLVVLATFLPASNATADNSVNCEAYAQEAIKDAKEAKARGCGFTDSLWSLDYNGHRNWCRLDNIKMANLTWADRARKEGLQQCKDKSDAHFKNHRNREKGCLAYAKKAVKLDAEIRDNCPSNNAWPQQLKAHVDWCMKKGGAQYAHIENIKRTGIIAGCRLDVQKAKLAQTKIFPDSGKVSARRKRPLPVDVCMRKFNRDNSWFLGLGGGMTDVPFGNDCGRSVATAFCITKGYVEAIEAPVKTYDRGRDMDGLLASTYWIGSKKACHGKCAGFQYIKCKGKL